MTIPDQEPRSLRLWRRKPCPDCAELAGLRSRVAQLETQLAARVLAEKLGPQVAATPLRPELLRSLASTPSPVGEKRGRHAVDADTVRIAVLPEPAEKAS